MNPAAERERLQRKINRRVRRMALDHYHKQFDKAYIEEVEKPFGQPFSVIINTWPVERLREIDDRLERRTLELFRNG